MAPRKKKTKSEETKTEEKKTTKKSDLSYINYEKV